MRFLLDVCVASRSMHSLLTRSGHDVLSAAIVNPRATDEELLAAAAAEERILVTEDKDFGEIVFIRRLPHPCIIRFTDIPLAEKVAAMETLIQHHSDDMTWGNLIVVSQSRVRIRSTGS